MIQDLDSTVEALLLHELPRHLADQVTITFATPDERFPPDTVKLPALDLFLYDLRENRDLRSAEWTVDLDLDTRTLTRERPPVRVDCTYLVTAWPHTSSSKATVDEHGLLGAALKALLRYTTLPRQVLQGDLADATSDVPTATLGQGRVDDMANFWHALGGRPRAGFAYTVTIAVQALAPLPAGTPVTDSETLLAPSTAPEPGPDR